MPCNCWFEPSEESKKLIKKACEQIVKEIKSLESIGEPSGVSLTHAKTLLDHLYHDNCPEKPNKD